MRRENVPLCPSVAGLDPAPGMVAVAATAEHPRAQVVIGAAEQLPFATGTVDLIVTVTSFDHWADQRRGLTECARVLRPRAALVLCDLFSPVLLPTMWLGHRGKARTAATATAALHGTGFHSLTWHHSTLIKTVVAT
jgi:ubiquinone/menaquinone biosynthesis C-methylase UbiE